MTWPDLPLLDWVNGSLTGFSKIFTRLFGSEDQLDVATKELTSARTEYLKHQAAIRTDDLFKNPDTKKKFLGIYSIVNKYQIVMEANCKSGFNFFFKEVNDRYIALIKSMVGSKARMEPVGVVFSGLPGHGKSVLMNFIARTVAKDQLLESGQKPTSADISENIYAIPSGKVDFWDGYTMQDVVMIDDAFSDADYTTVLPLLQLISTAPTHVNMADLSEKGRYFTSKLVVCSSNFSNIQGYNEISNKEAIERRFEICYDLRTKDGQKLDLERLIKEAEVAGGPDEVWKILDKAVELRAYKFGKAQYSTKATKPSEVRDIIKKRLQTKQGVS